MPVRVIEPDSGRPAGRVTEMTEMHPVTEAGPSFASIPPPSGPSSTYASVRDVEALSRTRKIGEGNNPTADDVTVYLELAAGEINSILRNKGYAVPVESTAPIATALLRSMNAKGAQLLLEEASPSSPNLDRIRKEWEAALLKLESAELSLDAATDVEQARPRGPGLTVAPAGTLESRPFFRRDQVF